MRAPTDFETAYAKFKNERREVVLVTPSLATFNARDKIIAIASANRVPESILLRADDIIR